MKIRVKVKPNSRIKSIEQDNEGVYIVRVNAPPVEGKANKRVIELLSKEFKVPKTSIELSAGHKSKIKTFIIPS